MILSEFLGLRKIRIQRTDVFPGSATKDSLILVDELGRRAYFPSNPIKGADDSASRGTSTIEGIGIAHAIAERLIELRVSWPRLIGPRLTIRCRFTFTIKGILLFYDVSKMAFRKLAHGVF